MKQQARPFKRYLSVALGLVITLCLALTSANISSAATALTDQASVSQESLDQWGLTREDVQRYQTAQKMLTNGDLDARHLRNELANSSLERTRHVNFTTYNLGRGVEISILDEAVVKDRIANSPQLSGGTWSGGFYVKFNNTDQQALVNGGAFLLGAAICAIPAVGWVACAVVGAIIAIATTYVNARGICTKNRQLRINMDWAGNMQRAYCTS